MSDPEPRLSNTSADRGVTSTINKSSTPVTSNPSTSGCVGAARPEVPGGESGVPADPQKNTEHVCRHCGARGKRLKQEAHRTICKRADVVPFDRAHIEPEVKLVAVLLCELCLAGAGGECHTPGCALWMNRAPDVPVQTVADLKVELAIGGPDA